VFADAGCLERTRGFTAVHAVHVTQDDRELLARQHVCACPTTEADLGDGLVPATELAVAGTTFSLGSDSNAVIDLIQEARLLEMGERLRTGRRMCLSTPHRPVARALLDAATTGGASSLGQAPRLGRLRIGAPFDACVVDLRHPSLAHVAGDRALDALLLSGTAACVQATFVGGRRIA
jgi:formimidoylglutamate deiminase